MIDEGNLRRKMHIDSYLLFISVVRRILFKIYAAAYKKVYGIK
jgi:hypothetical protein